MSSIPLISHHLFVAAAKTGGWVTSQRDINRQELPAKPRRVLGASPLELVDVGESMSSRFASPAGTSAGRQERRRRSSRPGPP